MINFNPQLLLFYLTSMLCEVVQLDLNHPTADYELEILQARTFRANLQAIDFQYGVWTNYSPLSNVQSVGNIPFDKINCQIIHSIRDGDAETYYLFYYICFDLNQQKIRLTINNISYNQEIYEQALELDSQNQKYQGQWFYFHLTSQPTLQKYYYCILNYDGSIVQESQLNDYLPFPSYYVHLYFGNSQQNSNPNLNVPQFSSFMGFIFINKLSQTSPFLNSVEDILSFWQMNNINIHCLSAYSSYPITAEIASAYNFNPYITIDNEYQVFGWLKIIGKLSKEQTIEILRIFPKVDLTLTSQFQEIIITKIKYKRTYNDEYQIIVNTYSYIIPMITDDYNLNQITKIYDEFTIIPKSLAKWFYLIVTFNDNINQLTIQFQLIKHQLSYNKIYYVKQFTNYEIQINLGYNLKLTSVKISFYSLQVQACKIVIPYPQCHKKCLTCSGPTENNCVTCNSDQHRQFDSIRNQCVCEYGYVDNNSICQNADDFNFIITTQSNDEIQNAYCGYTTQSLNNECISCPGVINDLVQHCMECLVQRDWLHNGGTCSVNLVSVNGSTFQNQVVQQTAYIYQNNELTLCEFCSYICNNNWCDLSNYKNFGEPTYILCNSESVYFNGDCIKTRITYLTYSSDNCGQNCKQCDDNKCLQCEDNSLYYRSFIDPSNCVSCLIDNCKYCVEYSIIDYSIISLTQYINDNLDDIVVGCAKCYDGFTYSFITRQCEYVTVEEPCIKQVIGVDGTQKCLESQNNLISAISYQNCQYLIENCVLCINDQCIQCGKGFKLQNHKCDICASYEYCIAYSYNSWMYELQSFYYYCTNQLIDIQPSDGDGGEIGLGCANNQILINQICFKKCDLDCECGLFTIPVMYYCDKCSPDSYGVPQLTQNITSTTCQHCSYQCIYCVSYQDGEIEQINPFYTTLTSQSRCGIKNALLPKTTFIDTRTGRVRQCQNGLPNCQLNLSYVKHIDCQLDESYFNTVASFFTSERYYEIFQTQLIDIISPDIIEYIMTIQEDMNLCYNSPQIYMIQTQQTEYLSIKEVNIKFTTSNNRFYISFFNSLTLSDFSTCSLENLIFLPTDFIIFEIRSYYHIKLINHLFLQNIYINGTGTNNELKMSFYMEYFSSFILKNITFQNLYVINQQIFDYSVLDLDIVELITFQTLIYSDCIFKNSNFIVVKPSDHKAIITIENLIFQNTSFINSSFCLLQQSQQQVELILKNIVFINSSFQNSLFCETSTSTKLEIEQIQIFNSELINSTLFKISNQFSIITVQIKNTNLSNSYFIYCQSLLLSIQLDFKMSNFDLSNLIISNSYIAYMNFIETAELNITIQDVIHKNIIHLNTTQEDKACLYVILKHNNQQNLVYSQQIHILNFTLSSDQFETQKPIKLKQSCFTATGMITSIYILGFSQVNILNMLIQNQLFKDKVVIYLNSLYDEVNNQITLSNISLSYNILVKAEGKLPSILLQIETDQEINITLSDISFNSNIIHQYEQDLKITPSFFVMINAYSSSIVIQKMIIDQNIMTNSSAAFIYTDSENLTIDQLYVLNHNQIQPLYQYVDLELENILLEQEIINQQFEIKTIGCGIISASNIFISNSKFINGKSLSIPILKIIGKQSLEVSMDSIEISNFQPNLNSIPRIYGSFYIDSSNSLLKLYFRNFDVSEIYNRLETAFLYIIPSQVFNQIDINNINMKNVNSLRNGFMYLNLQNTYSTNNHVNLQNISINNQNTKTYLSLFKKLNNYDLNYIQTNNGYFFYSYCNIKIYDAKVQGSFQSKLLEIQNSENITLMNLQLSNITTNDQIIVLELKQNCNLIMKSLLIESIQIYSYEHVAEIASSSKQIELIQDEYCNVISTSQLNQIISQDTSQYVINQLLNPITSLFIFNLSLNSVVILTNIHMKQVNCLNCSQGLFAMISQLQNKFQITSSVFQNNTNSKSSLINFTINDNNTELIVKNTLFNFNKCLIGCGIYICSGILSLEHVSFHQNTASHYGSSLYAKSLTELRVVSTNIQNNLDPNGATFYLSNFKLNSQDLLELSFNNNRVNNLYEVPSFYQFVYQEASLARIDYQILSTNYSIPNYQQYYKKDFKEYFFIPSGQQLKEYHLYDMIRGEYTKQEFDFRFQLINQYNEIIINYEELNCTLFERQFDLMTQEEVQYQIFQSNIEFDQSTQSINFANTTFLFDPYFNTSVILQLKLMCSQVPNYYFVANFKTFPCQMGEYYKNQGCFKCDYEKGYYSVKENSTLCQQIDYQKIANITSNRLQLKPQYWRYRIDTNAIEYCLRSFEACLGGWDVGIESCKVGHIGALCEECDIVNLRGNIKYFKSTQYVCQPCADSWSPILQLVFVSAWTLISISLTIQSLQLSNKEFRLLKLKTTQYQIIHKFKQDQVGPLIKMISNSVLLASTVFTFEFKLSIDYSIIQIFGMPQLSSSSNFICYLGYFPEIDFIYLRFIILIILPFVYFNLYMFMYLLYLVRTKTKYLSSFIYISSLYLFVSAQPDIIRYLGMLSSKRTISEEDWIAANVSYKYNTITHYKWLGFCILPIMLIVLIFIPLFLFRQLYTNNKQLNSNSIRNKYSYLYNEYTLKSYYWEIVKIIVKSLQIIILTIYETETISKCSFLIFIQIIYLFMIQQIKPYNSSKLNSLDIRSGYYSIMILLIALNMYNQMQIERDQFLMYLFQITLLILIIIQFIPFFYLLIFEYINKNTKLISNLFTYLHKRRYRLFCFRLIQKYFEKQQRKELVNRRFIQLKRYLLEQSRSIRAVQRQIQQNRLISNNNISRDIDLQNSLLQNNCPAIPINSIRQNVTEI